MVVSKTLILRQAPNGTCFKVTKGLNLFGVPFATYFWEPFGTCMWAVFELCVGYKAVFIISWLFDQGFKLKTMFI